MSRIKFLPKFVDSRGWSLNGIYDLFDGQEFQVNYSILYPGVVKAWHRHQHQDDYFCILKGMAQVGIYNESHPEPEKYFIGEHNPAVVHVKAGEWHGLTAVGNEPCGLLYLVTKKYNPDIPDEERAGPFDFVGKDWWLPENK
jgi:dTDP-4-dehydrorhamnose 3,5-epimerase|tara:strand:+ start:71 stop:496 length:426 start_codon:yes stop_codon:yes gene_type:complete